MDVKSAPGTTAKPQTSAQLAAQESREARDAMFAALDDLKQSAASAADPRLWTREHPWAAVGIAAAAGFAAAAALTPRRDETAKEHFQHLAEQLRAATRSAESNGTDAEQRATWTQAGLHQLFDLAKVALGNAALVAFQSRMAQYAAQPATDQEGVAAHEAGVSTEDDGVATADASPASEPA